MAQLPGYDPSDYTGKDFDESLLADLDAEFAAIKAVLDAARSNLASFQRDDTLLKNGSVHKDALAAETLSLFAAAWNPRGPWATATQYNKLDVVTNGGTWLCVSDHTSGTFATDLGNGLWMEITAEAANDTGLLRVSSAGTSTAYTITTGNSYAQLSDIPPMVVSWHVASGASPTLAVDGLPQRPLQIGTVAVAAGQLEHEQLIVYDEEQEAYLLVVLESATATSPQIAATVSTNTTITDGDLSTASHYIQPVNISAGSGQTTVITLPAPAAGNANKFVSVRVQLYTASSGNKVQIKDDLGAVLYEGEDKGDFGTVVSNGSSWFLWDKEAHPNTLRKSADYTITEADLNGPLCVVAVDASGGDVLITLPTAVLLDGQIVRVYLSVDAGAGNDVTVEQNNGVVLWTGVLKGDFVEITANRNPALYEVIAHHESYYARVYVDANESIAVGASEKIINISETADIGGVWTTANDRLDVPFDCYIDIDWHVLSAAVGRHGFTAEAKLDTTYIRSGAAVGAANPSDSASQNPSLSARISASSGQTLELWARNHDSANAELIAGDAAGNESFATFKITRRYS